MFNETSAICEDINSSLMSIVYLILSDGGITMSCDPDPGVLVRVDFVLNKLPHAVFMHVNTASLAVVYLAVHHSRIGVGLHLKAGNTVVVNVVRVEITLENWRP